MIKQWVVDIGLVTFGLIWIAGGIAFQTPDLQGARVLCLVFGIACVTLGGGDLTFGAPTTPVNYGDAQSWQLALFGFTTLVLGILGAAQIAIYYPFDVPEWKGQAPWIGWVFFAGLVWFSAVGALLIRVSRRK